MSSGSYFPGPVRAVEIPKKGKKGGIRVLGVKGRQRRRRAATAGSIEQGFGIDPHPHLPVAHEEPEAEEEPPLRQGNRRLLTVDLERSARCSA
jgi:hypothetical protein